MQAEYDQARLLNQAKPDLRKNEDNSRPILAAHSRAPALDNIRVRRPFRVRQSPLQTAQSTTAAEMLRWAEVQGSPLLKTTAGRRTRSSTRPPRADRRNDKKKRRRHASTDKKRRGTVLLKLQGEDQPSQISTLVAVPGAWGDDSRLALRASWTAAEKRITRMITKSHRERVTRRSRREVQKAEDVAQTWTRT